MTDAMTEAAFRRAGFSGGRPKLKDSEEPGKARSQYPDNRQALIDLFSDDVVGECLALGGGNVFLTAANLVDVLITAGITATGRPLDISGVENGGLITTFVSGQQGTQDLERRAASLRRQALLNKS